MVWGTSGIKCLGLGELCAHVLSSTQPGALYQVAGELRDVVLNLTAGEFRKTDNDKDTEDAVEKNYEMDTAVSAFIQAGGNVVHVAATSLRKITPKFKPGSARRLPIPRNSRSQKLAALRSRQKRIRRSARLYALR